MLASAVTDVLWVVAGFLAARMLWGYVRNLRSKYDYDWHSPYLVDWSDEALAGGLRSLEAVPPQGVYAPLSDSGLSPLSLADGADRQQGIAWPE